jgi:dTMP kinase
MRKGIFIAIDGIDGCGSTTQVEILGKYLQKRGENIHLTREPSEFEIGKLLRKYLKKPETPIPTDALLFAADRVEHYYKEILPKIQNNYIVVSDRYLESSIAYQATQTILNRKLSENPVSIDAAIDWIKNINKYIPLPDITFILDIDPRISLKRKYSKLDSDDIEKFENESFLDEVRKTYILRAKALKFVIIDAHQSLEIVSKEIINVLIDYMNKMA